MLNIRMFFLFQVLKAITRMVEEWVKQRSASVNSSTVCAPSLREKSILLAKLMHNVEKRFPDDQELNAQFLEMINYVYRSVNTIQFNYILHQHTYKQNLKYVLKGLSLL